MNECRSTNIHPEQNTLNKYNIDQDDTKTRQMNGITYMCIVM